MLLTRWFRSEKRQPRVQRPWRRRATVRPQVVALEERCLLTASLFQVAPAVSSIPGDVALSVRVTALDPSNSVAADYRGTVHFSSTDSVASLPADYLFTAADNGAHTFAVTLHTPGKQSLVVTDTANPTLHGAAATTQNVVAVFQSSEEHHHGPGRKPLVHRV